jgi:hypothetical protein
MVHFLKCIENINGFYNEKQTKGVGLGVVCFVDCPSS